MLEVTPEVPSNPVKTWSSGLFRPPPFRWAVVLTPTGSRCCSISPESLSSFSGEGTRRCPLLVVSNVMLYSMVGFMFLLFAFCSFRSLVLPVILFMELFYPPKSGVVWNHKHRWRLDLCVFAGGDSPEIWGWMDFQHI